MPYKSLELCYPCHNWGQKHASNTVQQDKLEKHLQADPAHRTVHCVRVNEYAEDYVTAVNTGKRVRKSRDYGVLAPGRLLGFLFLPSRFSLSLFPVSIPDPSPKYWGLGRTGRRNRAGQGGAPQWDRTGFWMTAVQK